MLSPLENFAKKRPLLLSLLYLFLYVLCCVFIVPNLLLQYIIKTLLSILFLVLTGLFKNCGLKIKGTGHGLYLGFLFILNGIGGLVIAVLNSDFSSLSLVPFYDICIFTINMLFVGLNEELSFRAFILTSLLNKKQKNYKNIIHSLLLSSLLFSLVHLVNIPFIQPKALFVQLIAAFSAGLCLGAIYIRSQSIWPSIIIHSLIDWFSLFISSCFISSTENISASVLNMDMNIWAAIFIAILSSIIPIIMTIVLMRPKYFYFDSLNEEDKN